MTTVPWAGLESRQNDSWTSCSFSHRHNHHLEPARFSPASGYRLSDLWAEVKPFGSWRNPVLQSDDVWCARDAPTRSTNPSPGSPTATGQISIATSPPFFLVASDGTLQLKGWPPGNYLGGTLFPPPTPAINFDRHSGRQVLAMSRQFGSAQYLRVRHDRQRLRIAPWPAMINIPI